MAEIQDKRTGRKYEIKNRENGEEYFLIDDKPYSVQKSIKTGNWHLLAPKGMIPEGFEDEDADMKEIFRESVNTFFPFTKFVAKKTDNNNIAVIPTLAAEAAMIPASGIKTVGLKGVKQVQNAYKAVLDGLAAPINYAGRVAEKIVGANPPLLSETAFGKSVNALGKDIASLRNQDKAQLMDKLKLEIGSLRAKFNSLKSSTSAEKQSELIDVMENLEKKKLEYEKLSEAFQIDNINARQALARGGVLIGGKDYMADLAEESFIP
jgi:hypothetical protein